MHGEKRRFSPIQIVALYLRKIKELAENKVKHVVTNIIVSVPLYFLHMHRLALVQAASLVNLTCHLIFSTSAIGIAAALDDTSKGEKHVVIIDFGAGKLDTSYFCLEEGIVEMKENVSNRKLGGEHFDQRLVAYCVSQVSEKYKFDISANKTALQQLKLACEAAKIKLSHENSANIEIKELLDTDICIEITREQFEKLCEDLFSQIPEQLETLVKASKLSKEKFNDIFMFGGSSHIPKVQSIISNCFGGKELNFSFNFPHVFLDFM